MALPRPTLLSGQLAGTCTPAAGVPRQAADTLHHQLPLRKHAAVASALLPRVPKLRVPWLGCGGAMPTLVRPPGLTARVAPPMPFPCPEAGASSYQQRAAGSPRPSFGATEPCPPASGWLPSAEPPQVPSTRLHPRGPAQPQQRRDTCRTHTFCIPSLSGQPVGTAPAPPSPCIGTYRGLQHMRRRAADPAVQANGNRRTQ